MGISKHINKLVLLTLFLAFSLLSCDQFMADVLYQKGSKAHDTGDFKKAIELYKKSVELNPIEAIVHYDLGVAYIDAKDVPNMYVQIDKLKALGREDLSDELEKSYKRSKLVK